MGVIDIRVAVQRFWAIVEKVRYTDAYAQATFTRADVLAWRNQPVILTLRVLNMGAVLAGARGAVEFRPPISNATLPFPSVFCEQQYRDVEVELQIESDYVNLDDAAAVIAKTKKQWPAVIVSYV